MASVIIIGLFVLIASLGHTISQHIGPQYNSPLNGKIGPGVYHTFFWQELTRQDELPSGQYWLGTAYLGRDILARLMQGLLISLAVAILVEVVDIVLGLLIWVPAGFYGGRIDQVPASFPALLFASTGLLLLIVITGAYCP